MSEDNLYSEEDPVEDTSGYYSGEGNAAVMKNFFDLTGYVRRKIAFWQGYTVMNGKKTPTHEPVGPDSFIYSVIGIVDAVVAQHNSVSYLDRDAANRILFESILAFNDTVMNEPYFNWKRYDMMIEEFDHMLEMFMGLVIKGHGTKVATALQAGVVSEMNPSDAQNNGIMARFSQALSGGQK